MTVDDTGEWLTSKQARRLLGVSTCELMHLRESGRLRHRRQGNAILYLRTEAVANEESGADDRLLKAQQLQDKLKLILEGESPYDIFAKRSGNIAKRPLVNSGLECCCKNKVHCEAAMAHCSPCLTDGMRRS